MTAAETAEEPIDPEFRREPRAGAGVLVIAIETADAPAADSVARGLAVLLRERGREADCVVVETRDGLARALERGLDRATAPLVLVTGAVSPWSADHLDPLLKAIDACDHVIGRRRVGLFARMARGFGGLLWRGLFAVPVADVHSPCRLHRREALEAIVPQSASSFLDVEMLAKATFLKHLIDEVDVPPLASPGSRGVWGDFFDVFGHPRFRREPSTPAEQSQGQVEGADGPGREDRQGEIDGGIGQAVAPEDHGPQGVQQLREGQGLDHGLDDRRES